MIKGIKYKRRLEGEGLKEMTLKLTIGSNLAIIRKYRGLTQIQLAKESGITQKYISEIENADVSVSVDILEKICKSLDVSINMIIKESIDWELIETVDYFIGKLEDLDIAKTLYLILISNYLYKQKTGIEWFNFDFREMQKHMTLFNEMKDIFNTTQRISKDGYPYIIFLNGSKKIKKILYLTQQKAKFLNNIIDVYGKKPGIELSDILLNNKKQLELV